MALFLNESLVGEVQVGTLHEAYEGLLEATYEMYELTESLLQADFIIHEECKSLNEAEQIEKKENFLVKAARAVKKFLISVKDRIMEFFKKVGERLKSIWDSIVGANKGVLVPENAEAPLVEAAKAVEDLQKAVNQPADNPSAYKKVVDAKNAIANKAIDKAKSFFGKKDGSPVKQKIVPINTIKGVFTLAIAAATVGLGVNKLLSNRGAKLDAATATVETASNTTNSSPEATATKVKSEKVLKTEIEASKVQSSATTKAASTAGKLTSMLVTFGVSKLPDGAKGKIDKAVAVGKAGKLLYGMARGK